MVVPGKFGVQRKEEIDYANNKTIPQELQL